MTSARWRLNREKLRCLRKQRGWTNAQAALQCGISREHYCRLENGVNSTPWKATLEGICKAFKLRSVAELLVPMEWPEDENYSLLDKYAKHEKGFNQSASFRADADGNKVSNETRPIRPLDVMDSLRSELAKKDQMYERLEIALPNNERTLVMGDALSVRVRSNLSGWLTLIGVADDQSMYLVPCEAQSPYMKVSARRDYVLPRDYQPTASWSTQGFKGRHILFGIVSRTDSLVAVPEIENLRVGATRGFAVKFITFWDLPMKDLAIGFLEFTVAAKA